MKYLEIALDTGSVLRVASNSVEKADGLIYMTDVKTGDEYEVSVGHIVYMKASSITPVEEEERF